MDKNTEHPPRPDHDPEPCQELEPWPEKFVFDTPEVRDYCWDCGWHKDDHDA